MSLRSTIKALADPTKIVTPRYRKWLRKHHDDPYPDWVVDLMLKELSKQQRDRTGSFSGSTAGACLRAQELAFLGVQPPFSTQPNIDLLSIFDDGRWRHLRWQANLLSAGILTRIEVPLDWPAKRSRGSMDGMGVVPLDHPMKRWRGMDFGFELKGVNGFHFSKLVKEPLPKGEHLNQIDRYFLSSGVDLFVALYECKLTQRTHEWVVERNAARIAATKRELDELNQAIDTQTLHPMFPACEHHMGKSWESCAYGGRGGICETLHLKGQTWL